MKIPDKKQTKVVLESVFAVSCLWSIALAGVYFQRQENMLLAAQQAAGVLLTEVRIAPTIIEGKSAVVYDAKTGKILFAKNADDALPLASLTKIMSAEAILATQDPSTAVFITPQDLTSEGDSGLEAGEVWSLKDLLTYGLVASSNDAMAAAAASAGTTSIIDRMNSTAQALGLTNMRFANPTGLDISEEAAGAYGSAHDMALLVADFLQKHPSLFSATVSAATPIRGSGKEMLAVPTAEPILDIPGLIGAKTGYTELAGGNLVVAFDIEIGHPIIVVVLGSSREGRFEDVRMLIDASRITVRQN